MKKSLTLAMAMVLGISASAYAANPFSDVPAGHWAYDSVAKLAAVGIVDGYADGAFDGDKLMTRYEMAQIVAKAMAKGASVNKLAAEFADELDTLGVRVAKLESKADAVKITGEVRYNYVDYTENSIIGKHSINDNDLRTRIWLRGAVNDDWTYTGMLENIQCFRNESGEEDTDFQRAYVEGKLGGVNVLAGRYNVFLVNGNLYDTRADGVELSYGKDIKVTGFYMKPTDQDGYFGSDESYNNYLEYKHAYGVKVDSAIGVVGTTVGYTVFNDGVDSLYKTGIDKVFGSIPQEDNKIWNIGIKFDVTKDLKLTADYLKSDLDALSISNNQYLGLPDDDGYIVSLSYKGAKASEPGSYGIYTNYYDQARGTVIAHTMNAYYGCWGFKGYMIGVNYTLAKNIVAALEWYDLKAKHLTHQNGSTPDVDMETLWAQVVFTF